MAKIKAEYEKLLVEAKTRREPYQVAMLAALKNTHDLEEKRLKQYLDSFKTLQSLVATAKYPNSEKISEKFQEAINTHNTQADLTFWNTNYGSENNLPWGVLEELKE